MNGKPADKNKTLQELGIKNGQPILFVKNKNIKNELKMSHRERRSFNKHRGEYYSLKILNDIEKKNNNDSKEFESYESFYNKKD